LLISIHRVIIIKKMPRKPDENMVKALATGRLR